MAGWLDNDPNARCVPIYWLPTFSPNACYANPASRCSEIEGWIASLQRARAWLNAAGRTEQRLLCVGDGRGDTQALGKLELPNTVCCVRTRKDSRWCDLPQGAPSGRGRRRVYSDPVWTPQDKWQQRTGWRRVPLTVRGRAVRLLVRVAGPCRRVGWGKRVFFVIVVRGHHKRTKRGKSRAPMAFWVHAVSDGADGWQLPVPLKSLLLKLWQRWEVADGVFVGRGVGVGGTGVAVAVGDGVAVGVSVGAGVGPGSMVGVGVAVGGVVNVDVGVAMSITGNGAGVGGGAKRNLPARTAPPPPRINAPSARSAINAGCSGRRGGTAAPVVGGGGGSGASCRAEGGRTSPMPVGASAATRTMSGAGRGVLAIGRSGASIRAAERSARTNSLAVR